MKFALLFVFFSIALVAKSQDTIVKYFDVNWKEVKESEAAFYRKAYKISGSKWKVEDYYLSGQMQMSGTYLSKELKKKNGKFIYFFDNGQKEIEGEYKNGGKVGEWIWWFENGSMCEQGKYDSRGKKTDFWKRWYSNGQLDNEGRYINGKHDDEWKWFFKNGQMSSKELYKNGELISFTFWDEEGHELENGIEFEVMPEYIGGVDALTAYLGSSVNYPEKARLAKKSGRVLIDFVVGINGEIEGVKVRQSVHPLLDNEALRVVSEMKKWKNGLQHNRPVRVSYTVPINFRLE